MQASKAASNDMDEDTKEPAKRPLAPFLEETSDETQTAHDECKPVEPKKSKTDSAPPHDEASTQEDEPLPNQVFREASVATEQT